MASTIVLTPSTDKTGAAGTAWRSPVIISGCCFEGDGTNVPAGGGPATGGEYAGIRVQGRNRVFIDGTAVVVNTTDLSAAMGTPFVAARAAGSFTIESTGGADASTVAWMIM